jgi:membrane-associated phospholipid phosphatase
LLAFNKMNINFSRLRNSRLCVVILGCAFLAAAQNSQAQNPSGPPKPPAQSPQPITQPTPQAKTKAALERNLLKNILHDQVAIWTSPLSLRWKDALWLAPFGAGTEFLIKTDRQTAGAVDSSGSLQPVSRGVSHFGSPYWTSGIAATFYLVGRVRNDARARETGLLSVEALLDGMMVIEPIKTITRRSRPLSKGGRGEFLTGGNAFPSGHAMSAWALATVVAYEYGEGRPLVRAGAYSYATLVSLSRFGGRTHFMSDALVGSAIGYGIGRYVFFKHHDRSLDSTDSQSDSKTRSELWPSATPYFRREDRRPSQYGLTLMWNF